MNNRTELTNALVIFGCPSAVETGVLITTSYKDIPGVASSEVRRTILMMSARLVRAECLGAISEVIPVLWRIVPFTGSLATLICISVEKLQ